MNETLYSRMPKIELHVHLEGAIPLPALWELVRKYGGDGHSSGARSSGGDSSIGGSERVASLDELEKRFEFRDFSHFLEMWSWKNRFLREYDDFSFIAEKVAENMAAQNVRYAEIFFSPSSYRKILKPAEIGHAVRKGFNRVPAVKTSLIVDLVRDYGPEAESITLSEMAEARECGIIGFGIGGSEHEFPPQPFVGIFEKARSLGFKTNAHAGEAAGAESVWGAARELNVDRIGHGIRAAEDENLMNWLAMHQTAIELCPGSNVKTGAIKSVSDHPIRKFLQHGIPVSINTDDPAMFGTSLAGEYSLLESKLGFTRGEVVKLIVDSIKTSWLTDEEKIGLTAQFSEEIAGLMKL